MAKGRRTEGDGGGNGTAPEKSPREPSGRLNRRHGGDSRAPRWGEPEPENAATAPAVTRPPKRRKLAGVVGWTGGGAARPPEVDGAASTSCGGDGEATSSLFVPAHDDPEPAAAAGGDGNEKRLSRCGPAAGFANLRPESGGGPEAACDFSDGRQDADGESEDVDDGSKNGDAGASASASAAPDEGRGGDRAARSRRRARARFKCGYAGCGKVYTKPCRLEVHIRSHTGERPCACPFPGCDKRYRKVEHLKAHMHVHDPENGKKLACPQDGCDKRFAARAKLKRHMQTHLRDKPFKCTRPDCEASFAKNAQLRRHTCAHDGKLPHPCTQHGCQQSYPTPSKLKHHLRSQHGEFKYVCADPACVDRSFRNWTLLQSHMRDEHRPVCLKCEKTFTRRDNLVKHMKMCGVPEKERPVHRCTWEGCTKTFTTEKIMKGHVKAKHEGLKPFECSVEACGKAFGYKHALARHNRTIHENPTPRKKRVPERTVVDLITGADYACNQARRLKCSGRDCNAAFKRKYDLDRHLRSVHSDHLSENAARIAGAGPPPAPVAEGAFATVGDPVAAGTVAVDPTAA